MQTQCKNRLSVGFQAGGSRRFVFVRYGAVWYEWYGVAWSWRHEAEAL